LAGRGFGLGEVECWDEEDWVVLITSGKRGRRGGASVQMSIRLGDGFGNNGLGLRELVT
jgi:hypothetical protein